MKELTAFKADDGTIFENEHDCKFYEEAINFMWRMKEFCSEQDCASCIFKKDGYPCHFEDKAGYPPETWDI